MIDYTVITIAILKYTSVNYIILKNCITRVLWRSTVVFRDIDENNN